jgi:hypothetical protein
VADAEGRIQQEPEEILGDPEQQQAAEHARLGAPRPAPGEDQREVEEQPDAGKHPGVIAGHGAAAPENVQQPVMFDAPGRQRAGPAGRAFDLDFHVGEEVRQQQRP